MLAIVLRGGLAWVGAFGVVVGIVGALAAAFGVLRANLSTTTIKSYQDANAGLQAELETANRQRAELRAEVAQLRAEVAASRAEITALREALTQRAAVEALSEKIESHHVEAMDGFDKLASLIVARTGGPK